MGCGRASRGYRDFHSGFQVAQPTQLANDPPTDLPDNVCNVGIAGLSIGGHAFGSGVVERGEGRSKTDVISAPVWLPAKAATFCYQTAFRFMPSYATIKAIVECVSALERKRRDLMDLLPHDVYTTKRQRLTTILMCHPLLTAYG